MEILHFKNLEQISTTNWGSVYRAFDPLLERTVALKVIRPLNLTSDLPGLLAEARAAAAVDHPHVCTIHQVQQMDDGVLAVGDVSGKGLPASLLMANLQATLRGQVLQGSSSKKCLSWCNRLLHLNTPPEKFATLFHCHLDPEMNRLTYGNAGHEHPFLIAEDGSIRRLKVGGLPVGILEDFDFQQEEVSLAPGDLLVAHSDGVTDMENTAGEPFGESRFQEFLLANRELDAQALVQAIIKSVQDFAGEAAPLDDLTVVVLRRLQ